MFASRHQAHALLAIGACIHVDIRLFLRALAAVYGTLRGLRWNDSGRYFWRCRAPLSFLLVEEDSSKSCQWGGSGRAVCTHQEMRCTRERKERGCLSRSPGGASIETGESFHFGLRREREKAVFLGGMNPKEFLPFRPTSICVSVSRASTATDASLFLQFVEAAV